MTILEARIRRSSLDTLAEDMYRDFSSKLIQDLRKEGKAALFGIEKENETYTVIGENSVYYITDSKIEKEISFEKFQDLFKSNLLQQEKSFEIENIYDEREDNIWVKNVKVLCAFSNIILLLSKNKFAMK